jgi:hypothetical protein
VRVQNAEVELAWPPVTVPVGARKRAFGYVIHGCLLGGGLGAFTVPVLFNLLSMQRKPSGKIDYCDRCDKIF